MFNKVDFFVSNSSFIYSDLTDPTIFGLWLLYKNIYTYTCRLLPRNLRLGEPISLAVNLRVGSLRELLVSRLDRPAGWDWRINSYIAGQHTSQAGQQFLQEKKGGLGWIKSRWGYIKVNVRGGGVYNVQK